MAAEAVWTGRWYVGLDQRLGHLLQYHATGQWNGLTLCGRSAFWPWFVAHPEERRCAACLRAQQTRHEQTS